MLATLRDLVDLEKLSDLLCTHNHEECTHCQKDGWVPKTKGRRRLHRHEAILIRLTPLLAMLVRQVCKRFKTDNEGMICLLVRALQVEGVIPWDSELVMKLYGAPHLPPEARKAAELYGPPRYPAVAKKEGEHQPFHNPEGTPAATKEAVKCHCHEHAPVVTKEAEELYSPEPATKVVEEAKVLPEPAAAEAKEEPPTEDPGPDLWTPLTVPLKERVSEENFEIWLSRLSFVSSHEPRLVLGCKTTFLQEYLSGHYKEVIEEELQKMGHTREVTFELKVQAEEEVPPEPPKKATPPGPDEVERMRLSPKAELRVRRRLAAKQMATCPRNGLNHAMVASLLGVLEDAEREEDRRGAEQQKDARREAWNNQSAGPSSWWSDDPAREKMLRGLVAPRNPKGTPPKRE